MSKVVKGIGRAVGKVVGGVGKLVTKVTGSKTLGKIAKVVAGAALVYVTGGAVAGALGTIGTSTSMLAGAQAGLSASWGGLMGAGKALIAGNLSGAGSALAGGWSTAAGAGASLQAAATPIAQFTSTLGAPASSALTGVGSIGAAPASGVFNTAGLTFGGAAPAAATSLAPAAAGGGNMLLKMAGVQAVGSLASGAMQAKAQNDAEKRQDQKEVQDRARYNTNMGARLSVFDDLMAKRQPYMPPQG